MLVHTHISSLSAQKIQISNSFFNGYLIGKKMKRSSLTATPAAAPSSLDHHQKSPPSLWQWPACAHLETLSFRAAVEEFNIFKPLPVNGILPNDTPIITRSSRRSLGSISMRSDVTGSEEIETVIRELRSDRLFFEPGVSKTLLEQASKVRDTHSSSCSCGFGLVPYKETVFVSMESTDPFIDFRRSMEEMIVTEGMKDWESLEELLGWYLKVNSKNNHGYIIGAFIDLLASSSFPVSSVSRSVKSESERTDTTAMAAAAMSSSSFFSCDCSPSSPMSFPPSSLTTPCLSSSDQVDEDDEQNGEANGHRTHFL